MFFKDRRCFKCIEMRWVVSPCSSSNGLSHNRSVDVTLRHWSGPQKTAECSPDTSLHHLRKRFPTFVRCLLWCRVGGGANLKARLRPPLKPDVRFSRIRLSQGCFCSEVSRKESAKPGSLAQIHRMLGFFHGYQFQIIESAHVSM